MFVLVFFNPFKELLNMCKPSWFTVVSRAVHVYDEEEEDDNRLQVVVPTPAQTL